MKNFVVRGLSDPYADRSVEMPAAVRDETIADDIALRQFFEMLVVTGPLLANFHAARAQVGEVAAGDRVVLAALSQFQRVAADLRNGAGIEFTIPRVLCVDRTPDIDLGLRRHITLRRQRNVAVFERQAFKVKMRHRLVGSRAALKIEQPFKRGAMTSAVWGSSPGSGMYSNSRLTLSK